MLGNAFTASVVGRIAVGLLRAIGIHHGGRGPLGGQWGTRGEHWWLSPGWTEHAPDRKRDIGAAA
eukprot:9721745-Lingulodinium_polyedra.AAC.1